MNVVNNDVCSKGLSLFSLISEGNRIFIVSSKGRSAKLLTMTKRRLSVRATTVRMTTQRHVGGGGGPKFLNKKVG